MSVDTSRFLERWHRIVADRDIDALRDMLAEGVTLGAPPYWQRFEGRDLVHFLLGLILKTIDGFTYHREWVRGSELALEFRGRVGDLELQGIDLISIGADGRLERIDVMIRPVNAVTMLQQTIAPRMTEFLAGRAASG